MMNVWIKYLSIPKGQQETKVSLVYCEMLSSASVTLNEWG